MGKLGLSLLVVFERDEDGWEVASCPTLPGCHSQGRTRREALDNIREAIRGYLASLRAHDAALPPSTATGGHGEECEMPPTAKGRRVGWPDLLRDEVAGGSLFQGRSLAGVRKPQPFRPQRSGDDLVATNSPGSHVTNVSASSSRTPARSAPT